MWKQVFLGFRMVILSDEERLRDEGRGKRGDETRFWFRDRRMRSILLFVSKSDRLWGKIRG